MLSPKAVDRAVKRAGALLLIGVVERLLFTRISFPRAIAGRFLAEKLARIEPEFDSALYLRQFRNQLRRRRAERAPMLHYAILGWREHRAPNARFDPAHYRRITPELTQHAEPFDHYLRIGRPADAPQNETESARRHYPSNAAALENAAAEDGTFGRDLAKRILVLHHGRGGGSGRLLTMFERELVAKGVYPLRLRPLTKTSPALFVCEDPPGEPHVFDLLKDQAAMIEFLRLTGVVGIFVNHVIDMPPEVVAWVVSASRALDAPYDVFLHDYFAVCPRVNLIDDNGGFCNVAAVERCGTCVAAANAEVDAPDMPAWRGRFADFLAKARMVMAPSADAQRRLEAHIGRDISVWCPEEENAPILWRPVGPDEPLRIALIGGLTAAKGLEEIIGLARAIRSANAPIQLFLIGSSSDDRRLRSAGVIVLGRYREKDIESHLAGLAPHAALIPSIWPETWSFVLSDALRAGLPTIVFDIGAPAERLKRLGRGEFVLPFAFAHDSGRMLDFFLAFRSRLTDALQLGFSTLDCGRRATQSSVRAGDTRAGCLRSNDV